MNIEVNILAQTIWDYMLMHQELRPMDAIFALGSNDTRIAGRAADLYLESYAPIIIFSGGRGRMTENNKKSEAETFCDVAFERGVPRESILLESKASNTGENVEFTRQLIKDHNLSINSFILVQKPYMERRTYATFKKVWPEPDIIVTSPQLSFGEYQNEYYTRDYVVNVMVGDLQRINPAKGFQIPQDIPDEVWAAYERLVVMGFTKHLIKG